MSRRGSRGTLALDLDLSPDVPGRREEGCRRGDDRAGFIDTEFEAIGARCAGPVHDHRYEGEIPVHALDRGEATQIGDTRVPDGEPRQAPALQFELAAIRERQIAEQEPVVARSEE